MRLLWKFYSTALTSSSLRKFQEMSSRLSAKPRVNAWCLCVPLHINSPQNVMTLCHLQRNSISTSEEMSGWTGSMSISLILVDKAFSSRLARQSRSYNHFARSVGHCYSREWLTVVRGFIVSSTYFVTKTWWHSTIAFCRSAYMTKNL